MYKGSLKTSLPRGERLYSLLAIAMACALVAGYAAFIGLSILPQVRIKHDTALHLDSARRLVAEAQNAQVPPEVWQQRIAATQARLAATAGSVFLDETRVAEMPTRLHEYAYETGVELVSLQADPGQRGNQNALYSVRTLRVRAVGALPKLARFIARTSEASGKGLGIRNLSLTNKGNQFDLTMDLLLYASPYALPQTVSTTAPSGPAPTATIQPVPKPTPVARHVTYTVQGKDTLYSIARRYGTTVQAIMAANGLDSPNIRVGQQLRIPLP